MEVGPWDRGSEVPYPHVEKRGVTMTRFETAVPTRSLSSLTSLVLLNAIHDNSSSRGMYLRSAQRSTEFILAVSWYHNKDDVT